jgi:hypothetical protein
MIAALTPFGANSGAIWVFAAGVLSVMFVVALILMGIEFIKTLVNK